MSSRKTFLIIFIFSVLSALVAGAVGSWLVLKYYYRPTTDNQPVTQTVSIQEESATVAVAAKASPAVVSIIVTKDLPRLRYNNPFGDDPLWRRFFGDQFDQFFSPSANNGGKQEVGGGSGFIVSADGYIITNKHVVEDETAEYTVLLNNNEKKYPAKVLAKDPSNDLAVIKIEAKDLSTLSFADVSQLKIGQSVIAIGNALGEFRNTVSAGVISGLARQITATGDLGSEALYGLIQTDASINPGNSGGPLLNLSGQVIGVNVAIAQGAQNIGFAIPANQIKTVYESVRANGKIVRPWLGVRYVIINPELARENKLPRDYGALIVRGEARTNLAVIPGSPADKAGLSENDIILSVNSEKVNDKNPLAPQIAKFKPGETIKLKIFHKDAEKEISVKLEELK